MEMRIRNVDYSTRMNIRKLARAENMSIGDYLNAKYGEVDIPDSGKRVTWVLKNVDSGVRKRLKRNAVAKKMTLSQYLEHLLKKDAQNDSELARDIKGYIDSALALIDDLS